MQRTYAKQNTIEVRNNQSIPKPHQQILAFADFGADPDDDTMSY